MIIPFGFLKKQGDLQTDFVSTWETTTASETITVPLSSTRTYDIVVDWGDGGGTDTYTGLGSGLTVSHVYATAGTYDITISQNTLNGWKGIFFNNGGDKTKIKDIVQWGNSELEAINFYGCTALTGGTATDFPDVTQVTFFTNVFRSCTSLNITNWASWQPISVTTFQACFRDTNNNGGDASWITSNAVDLDQMYLNNDGFNQDFGSADFTNVNQLSLFATNNDGWSTANIDATLNGIAAQAPSIQSGVTFDMGNGSRSAASDAAVTTLTTTYSWIINVN